MIVESTKWVVANNYTWMIYLSTLLTIVVLLLYAVATTGISTQVRVLVPYILFVWGVVTYAQ